MVKRIKSDLHNHFSTWRDGWGKFDKLIDDISQRFGEGIIGLANCEDNRYETFVDSSSENSRYERVEIGEDKNALWIPKRNIIIVRGQEIFTNQGHLLVLGTPKNHKIKTKNLSDAIMETKDIGAAIIAIHPYLQGTGIYLEQHPELLEQIDSIEIYNASLAIFGSKYNNLARRLYLESTQQSIGCCSFTDGHSIMAIGTSYTMIPQLDLTNSDTLRKSLKNALTQTRSEHYLKSNPARIDALKHGFELHVLRHFKKN